MTKRLVDIDDDLLAQAKSALETETIKDTVDRAFREAVEAKKERQRHAIANLAGFDWGYTDAEFDAKRREMWGHHD